MGSTGCPMDRMLPLECDLSSLDSVRHAVKEFIATGLHLDVLVCNAGVATLPQKVYTKDGYEMQFGVNFLGHWLLISSLLHLKPRVVNVASGAYRACKTLELDDLNFQRRPYHLFIAYAQSKLANVLCTLALQR